MILVYFALYLLLAAVMLIAIFKRINQWYVQRKTCWSFIIVAITWLPTCIDVFTAFGQ